MPQYIYTDGSEEWSVRQKAAEAPFSRLSEVFDAMLKKLPEGEEDREVWRVPQAASIHWRYLS